MATADPPADDHGRVAVAWHVTGDVAAAPDCVSLARHAVVGLLDRYGAPAALSARAALAVSEAVTNVVLHAYPDHRLPGPVRFDADIEEGDLEIVVADDGVGLRAEQDGDRLGLGLMLIAAVTDDFAITTHRSGLEVWMRFVVDPG